MKLNNKKVWITGGGTGIGLALAKAFAKEGAKLILSGRNTGKLEKARLDINSNHEIELIRIDLEDHDGIKTVFNENINKVSDVDILVNNAGISQRSLAEDTQFDVYKKLIDINYLGTVRLSLLMLEQFKKRNAGHFVVISSSAGKFGVPLRTGYSASKFALHGFFDAMRAEQHESGINITMVCPGFINTDISKNALNADGSSYGTMDEAQQKGMSPDAMATTVLNGIKRNKAEILVGGFKETKMAVWMSRFFPSIFRNMIAKMKVT